MTRTRAVLVLLCSVVVLLGTVASSPASAGGIDPIQPGNRPVPLAGMVNGALPATATYVQGPRCSIALQAAGSFVEMVAAARADGVGISPAECYRDYAGQVYWRTWWCDQGLCGNAAVPGTSNHGWGKAVDLRDDTGEFTWTSPGYLWMVRNAGRFGFNHPGGVDEAWHWEWVGDGGTLHGWPVRPDLWLPPVRGDIAREWTALGGARGLLGFARTTERPTPDGVGRYNHFDGGSVYWTPAVGAHEVHGAIRTRWSVLGWERGVLGYPTSDETAAPGGRLNTFERGTLAWSPATGAHEVHGAIAAEWDRLGGVRSPLGYPTTDERAVPGGRRSTFAHGAITWDAATGAVTVTR